MKSSSILSLEELIEITRKLQCDGKKVVSTSGCFDILHAGHVTYLEEAKKKGDILVVLLNSDESVKGLKGKERPIVPEIERAIVVSGLRCVDYVCIFEESTPCDILSKFKPDSFIKGGDYAGVFIPEMNVLYSYGGIVEYVTLVEGWSSTNIIEKIRRL